MEENQKKYLCPDCEREVEDDDDDCQHCGYPLRYHRARARVHAVEERERKKEAAAQEKKDAETKIKKRYGGGFPF